MLHDLIQTLRVDCKNATQMWIQLSATQDLSGDWMADFDTQHLSGLILIWESVFVFLQLLYFQTESSLLSTLNLKRRSCNPL